MAEENFGSREIIKVGIVVDDIEKAAEYYQKIFQFDSVPSVRLPDPNKKPEPGTYRLLRGQKTDPKLKCCIIPLGPVYLEVIEPCSGQPSPWLEFLEKNGPGVCFLSFYVNGLENTLDFMRENGAPAFFVEEKGFERYAYFETQKFLGVTLEAKEQDRLPSRGEEQG